MAGVSWNLRRAWRLRTNASVGRELDRLTLHPQPIPGWFFLRQDFEYLANGLTLDWFAGTRWQVWGAAS
ncbi:MAG: hypothetical protein NZM43_12935 [Saprospiraceae bacterium]|nr:hypothetical protein [Saprospiraceae bacterium]MDW8485219.1 hypothetical protein [Saprospiraceae bacterium]